MIDPAKKYVYECDYERWIDREISIDELRHLVVRILCMDARTDRFPVAVIGIRPWTTFHDLNGIAERPQFNLRLLPEEPQSQPEKECDTAHGLDEFHLFPWWRITDDTGLSAGGIVGGKDFNPCVPHIDFFKEGSHYVDAWEIPLAMEKLLKSYFEMGQDELRRKINGLLGR